MHRKPYLTIGALVYSGAFITYALAEIHDVLFLAVIVFIGTLGLVQMDVMADTMCCERSKFEPEATKVVVTQINFVLMGPTFVSLSHEIQKFPFSFFICYF